jgi:hypothetical protein
MTAGKPTWQANNPAWGDTEVQRLVSAAGRWSSGLAGLRLCSISGSAGSAAPRGSPAPQARTGWLPGAPGTPPAERQALGLPEVGDQAGSGPERDGGVDRDGQQGAARGAKLPGTSLVHQSQACRELPVSQPPYRAHLCLTRSALSTSIVSPLLMAVPSRVRISNGSYGQSQPVQGTTAACCSVFARMSRYGPVAAGITRHRTLEAAAKSGTSGHGPALAGTG